MSLENHRIWLKEAVAEADLAAFCEELEDSIFDYGVRLKIYQDGPNTQKWLLAILTNSALVCALVFASTFGSFLNSDLYNFAENASESTAHQYTAHTCYWWESDREAE